MANEYKLRGILKNSDTTDATAIDTGSMQTAGGASVKKSLAVGGRTMLAKGADVASANDITLGADGNYFWITGSTQVNAIRTANWTSGSIVVLHFNGSITVSHAQAGAAGFDPIYLKGEANWTAIAGDRLVLIYESTAGGWWELARTHDNGNDGFYGVNAPAAQPAGAAQAAVTAVTDSTGGTADGTIADVGAAFNQAALNNNFADVAAKINANVALLNAMRTVMVNAGLMKGSAL
jgi:hypothetical protein